VNREDFLRYVNLINQAVSDFEETRYSCLVREVENGALPLFLNIWDVRAEETELLVKEVLSNTVIVATGIWESENDNEKEFIIDLDYVLIPLDEIKLVGFTY